MRADLTDMFLLGEAFQFRSVRAGYICDTTDIAKWRCGEITGKITLKQNQRRYFRDLVGTTHTAIDLVSSRVQSALRDARATGWSAHPVEFVDRKRNPITGYDALIITGACGPLDYSRCRKGTRSLPGMIKPMEAYFGYYFAEDSWDGTDFFTPQGTSATIVTRRVKEVLDAIGATNIFLQPLLEVAIDPLIAARR